MSPDSAGTANPGVDLYADPGQRELITGGPSLADLDLTVTVTVNAQGDGTGSTAVYWHWSDPNDFIEFNIGAAGWHVVVVSSGMITYNASGSESVNPGDTATIHVVSSGSVGTVSLDGTAISGASILDGSSGAVGVGSNGADTTVTNVALSS